MGTKTAPSYACLFMAWLEETKLLKNWYGTPPHLWRRFIDDIFFIWQSSEEELKRFIDHLNTQHPYIKFTATYDVSTRRVPFLDMEVSIDDQGYIRTDLFKKETARCQYLLPSSCHPGHITKNIPFSLAYRLLRICSMPDVFNERLEELRVDLLKRAYRPKIIEDAFRRIRLISRKEALEKSSNIETEREPLVMTYHPSLPPLSKLVKKHWEVMTKTCPNLSRVFPKPSVVAYRRNKNLRDILVKAKIPQPRKNLQRSQGFKPCQRLCYMCALSSPASTHSCQSSIRKGVEDIRFNYV